MEIRRSKGHRPRNYVYEVEIDVLGLTGVTVDMSKCSNWGKDLNGSDAPLPENLRAVVAVFARGEFYASSGLSHSLKPSPKQIRRDDKLPLVALWNRKSRHSGSKIRFDVHTNDHSMAPEVFELWIALTDGRDDGTNCFSCPIGYSNLRLNGAEERNFLWDAPVHGVDESRGKDDSSKITDPTAELSSIEESSWSPFVNNCDEERKNECSKHKRSGSSAYRIDKSSGPILRMKVEWRRSRENRSVRGTSEEKSHRSKSLEESFASYGHAPNHFRPIETSSLVSETAFSLGGVVRSRLPSKPPSRGGFVDLGLEPNAGLPFDEAPSPTFSPSSPLGDDEGARQRSAFTRIRPRERAFSKTSVNSPSTSDPFYGARTRVESQDFPADEAHVLSAFGRMSRRTPLVAKGGSFSSVASNSQARLAGIPTLIKTEIKQKPPKKASSHRQSHFDAFSVSDVASGSMNRSIVSKQKQSGFGATMVNCLPQCGALLSVPLQMLTLDEEQTWVGGFHDDATLSTIETRDSSQIVARQRTLKDYAEESSVMWNKSSDSFTARNDPRCGFIGGGPTSSQKRLSKNDDDDMGWWNDIPGKGCTVPD